MKENKKPSKGWTEEEWLNFKDEATSRFADWAYSFSSVALAPIYIDPRHTTWLFHRVAELSNEQTN